MNLTVLDCKGCGACCRHMGTPPGYAAYFPIKRNQVQQWALESPDYEIFRSMPLELKRELRAYYDRVMAGKEPDRTLDRPGVDVPCLWYDEASRTCKHHKYRPTVCREFEIGCDACLQHRERHGIVKGGA